MPFQIQCPKQKTVFSRILFIYLFLAHHFLDPRAQIRILRYELSYVVAMEAQQTSLQSTVLWRVYDNYQFKSMHPRLISF